MNYSTKQVIYQNIIQIAFEKLFKNRISKLLRTQYNILCTHIFFLIRRKCKVYMSKTKIKNTYA